MSRFKRMKNNLNIKKEIFILVVFLALALFFNLPFQYDFNYNSQNSFNENEEIHVLRNASTSGGGYIMNSETSFSWIDISLSGISLAISNETNTYESISFSGQGWNFSFYETEYDSIYVSTNGWMSFTNNGDTSSYCSPIPDLSVENADCIALLCTELNPSLGGEIYYEFRGTSPNN